MVSILLAFAIQAWWEEVQERKRERSALAELRSEFTGNKDILVGTARAHRRSLRAMQAIVSASESPLPTATSLDSLFGVAQITPHYNPATGARAATIGSGRISLIKNVELRNRVAGWDRVVSDLILDEQTRRDFVVHEIRPTLATFGISGSTQVSSGAEADFAEAMRSQTLLAMLRNQISQVAHLLTHFEDAEEATEAMIADLTEELSSN